MSSIPEQALAEAKRQKLDLTTQKWMVDPRTFKFDCLEPKPSMLQAFRAAHAAGRDWVQGMPVPVLTFHSNDRSFRIMDGMLRICSAKKAGMTQIPAIMANGNTYDALEHILVKGYYGEDFIEMLAMVNPFVQANLAMRDRNKAMGRR